MLNLCCLFGGESTEYDVSLHSVTSVIENAEINCVATGENPDSVKITTEGNTVTVEFVS